MAGGGGQPAIDSNGWSPQPRGGGGSPCSGTRQPWESVLSEKRRRSRPRSGEHGHFRKQARKSCLWKRKNSHGQRNRGRLGRGECHERRIAETHLQRGPWKSLVTSARVIWQSGGDRS